MPMILVHVLIALFSAVTGRQRFSPLALIHQIVYLRAITSQWAIMAYADPNHPNFEATHWCGRDLPLGQNHRIPCPDNHGKHHDHHHTIAITGSTGQIGRRVATRLAATGTSQRLLVRDTARALRLPTPPPS